MLLKKQSTKTVLHHEHQLALDCEKNNLKFFRGSLTTPACYESVVWTVFDTPIRISRAQVIYWLTIVSKCENV